MLRLIIAATLLASILEGYLASAAELSPLILNEAELSPLEGSGEPTDEVVPRTHFEYLDPAALPALPIVVQREHVEDVVEVAMDETTDSLDATLLRLMAIHRATDAVFVHDPNVTSESAAYISSRRREVTADAVYEQDIWQWTLLGAVTSGRVERIDSGRPETLTKVGTNIIMAGANRVSEHFSQFAVGRLSKFAEDGSLDYDNDVVPHGASYAQIADSLLTGDASVLFVGSAGGEPEHVSLWVWELDPETMSPLWSRIYNLNTDTVESRGSGSVLEVHLKGEGIALSPDGGFTVVGTLTRPGGSQTDIGVFKFDKSRRIRWARACGGDNDDKGATVRPHPDGGYLVGGGSESFDNRGGAKGWLVRLDEHGFVLWDQFVGRESVEHIAFAGKNSYVLLDRSWSMYSVQVSAAPTITSEFWNGEASWTRHMSIASSSAPNPFSPSLTCLDLYWQPSLENALAGSASYQEAVRDRRIQP